VITGLALYCLWSEYGSLCLSYLRGLLLPTSSTPAYLVVVGLRLVISIHSSTPLWIHELITVLAGAPRTVMNKIQHVLNDTTRVITGTRKFDSGLSQILHHELHWLDVPTTRNYSHGSSAIWLLGPLSCRPARPWTFSQILFGTISEDYFRVICLADLKRICSFGMPTNAFNALRVLDDNCSIQIYIVTHLLTYGIHLHKFHRSQFTASRILDERVPVCHASHDVIYPFSSTCMSR